MKRSEHIFKRFSLFLLSFLLLGGVASAQFDGAFDDPEEERILKISGGIGYFSIGYGLRDMAPLNSSLGTDGFGAFEDNGITLGGGGQIIVRNFVIGGEGNNFIKKEVENGEDLARFRSNTGIFRFGYVVLSGKGFLLYPRIGVGGFTQELFLKDGSGNATFQDLVSSQGSGSILKKSGWLTEAALGFEFMPGFDETSGSGLVFGLDIGYQYAPGSQEWELWDEPITGGPGIDPGGLFIRLHIGGGGWHRQ